jgi:hypothetical protein
MECVSLSEHYTTYKCLLVRSRESVPSHALIPKETKRKAHAFASVSCIRTRSKVNCERCYGSSLQHFKTPRNISMSLESRQKAKISRNDLNPSSPLKSSATVSHAFFSSSEFKNIKPPSFLLPPPLYNLTLRLSLQNSNVSPNERKASLLLLQNIQEDFHAAGVF